MHRVQAEKMAGNKPQDFEAQRIKETGKEEMVW
jgi:hypothetical protein